MMSRGTADRRYPGEAILVGAGISMLSYYRGGDARRPLVVFAPGGGHLGRIAYGHPEGNPRDFLDHWLQAQGYGLLAPSYPGDHPALPEARPELTSTEWAACVADAARSIVERERLVPEIVIAGWSMGGKLVPACARAAARFGLALRCFVSLAATPPLPGLGARSAGGERLTEAGFWDSATPLAAGGSRIDAWASQLDEQSQLAGRCVIPREIYIRDYLCGTPIQLRGQPTRCRGGQVFEDLAETLEDLASFDFAALPIAATIVPAGAADAAHALTDRSAWGFLTQRGLYERHFAARGEALPPEAWRELLALIRGLPDALSREVEGGHFFFVGETGARATAEHIAALSVLAADASHRIAELAEEPSIPTRREG